MAHWDRRELNKLVAESPEEYKKRFPEPFSAMIPEDASSENKLATEAYVNEHGGGGSGSDPEAVKYTEQTLTEEQKAQALDNIGGASAESVTAETARATAAEEDIMDAIDGTNVETVTALPAASASTVGKFYYVGPDSNGEYARYRGIESGGSYSFLPVGTTEMNLSTYATKAEVDELEAKVDGVTYILRNAFIGGWTITASGYFKAIVATRVGIGEFIMFAGDKIKLSDYSACRFYVGWRKTDGTYGTSGAWKTADFTCPDDGEYVVTLEGIPAATVTDTEDLTQYVILERSVTAEDEINAAVNAYPHIMTIPSSRDNVYASISYDSVNNLIYIRNQVIIIGLKGQTVYKTLPATTVTPVAQGQQIIVYDAATDTVSAKAYNATLLNTEIVIAGFRKNSVYPGLSTFSTPLQWEVDGRLNGLLPINYSFLCVIPSGLKNPYCNYDTSNNTFTIPKDTVLVFSRIDGTKDYYVLPDDVVIDLSTQATSAVKIMFNFQTRTFSLSAYTGTVNYQYVVSFAFIRKESGSVAPAITCPAPWSIDGYPYGIKYIPTSPRKKGFVKGINHRGYKTVAPENTIPAFLLSAKNGFSYVECDVQFTSDGVPVILHDLTINRTARNEDGTEIENTINIADITYAQALNYDFGIWKGAEYAGTKIPTFEEFLVLCRNVGVFPYIELKAGTQVQIEGLADIAREYGMLNKCTWISGSTLYLGYIIGKDEYAKVSVVTVPTASNISQITALANGKNEVSVDSNVYTATEIEICKNAGLPLEVWTINTKNAILALPDYISGVTSDVLDAGQIFFEELIN